MPYIKTSKGKLFYKPISLYLGIKQIDREIAFDNLRVIIQVLKEATIQVSPAFGTLLGIIRDNNFIEWDEDIDLFVLKEDKERLIDSFWKLKEHGFELVRVERCDHLFSVMRNGEYIDFYIMDSISPEIRTGYGDLFMFEKYLIDLIEWDFRGLTISIPRHYEECLEFLYDDWRTPIKYANFALSNMAIRKAKFKTWLKTLLPFNIRFKLLKIHHKKDLDKFISKCQKKGIRLNYEIDY